MIYTCPRCQKKNRLPDTLQMDGVYRCGGCQQLLIGVAEESKTTNRAKPSVVPPCPAASGWSEAIRKKYPQYAHLTRFLHWSDRVWMQMREAQQQAKQRRGIRTKPKIWAERLTTAWKKAPKALALANGGYLLALALLAVSDALGPEESWLGSFNLYMPQWLWAIPGIVLLLLTLRFARRWAGVPLLALLWVSGPVMGFCWKGAFAAAPGTVSVGSETRLRIMTYNVKWGHHDGQAIADDVRAYHPDILQLQDSAGVMNGPLAQALAGWNVRVSGQYIVASPHPLPELEARDISFAGAGHHCVRYTLEMGPSPVTIYNVHLLSPRDGLVSVRHHQIGGMEWNAGARLLEADRLVGYVGQERGPTVLTGDLNAPVQSLVCRNLFHAGLRDAFSEAGFGYGYTYGQDTRIGHPYVRIDHIMASREWLVERCWVGNERGSEHCPVIADLVLRQ